MAVKTKRAGARGKTPVNRTGKLAAAALGIALVFLSTRLFQFPIPLGYANLGNCMILLFAVYFGPSTGLLAGGLGSALADLTSFPAWTLPTLLIKSVMGLICGLIAGRAGYPVTGRLKKPATFLAVLLSAAEMVLGYTFAGGVMYGSMAAGLSQLPGLAVEGVIGIILFYALSAMLEKTGVMTYVR